MAMTGDGKFAIWPRVVRFMLFLRDFRRALQVGADAFSFLLQWRTKSGEYSLTILTELKKPCELPRSEHVDAAQTRQTANPNPLLQNFSVS